jgi:hypothetical protein
MSSKAYNRRGQSIFEYFILTIIVVSIALYFVRNQNYVTVKNAAEVVFDQAVENITR